MNSNMNVHMKMNMKWVYRPKESAMSNPEPKESAMSNPEPEPERDVFYLNSAGEMKDVRDMNEHHLRNAILKEVQVWLDEMRSSNFTIIDFAAGCNTSNYLALKNELFIRFKGDYLK